MEFPAELARKVCTLVARRVLHRFAAFPDLEDEDLIADAMTAALEAWPRYTPKSPTNPHAAAPSSYIYQVAWRHLVDLYRTRSRRGEHETKAAEEAGMIGEPDEIAESPDEEDDLAEWAGRLYALTLTHLTSCGLDLRPAPANRGHFKSTFTRAHAIVLVAIQSRVRLSCRAAAHLLRKRPDVRRAIGLPRCPNPMVFSRAHRSVTRLKRKLVLSPVPSPN